MPHMQIRSKRALFLLSFIAFFVLNGFAKSRTSLEALSIANSFCQKDQSPMARSLSGKVTVNKLAYTAAQAATRSSDEKAYYYVFNVGENNGFVIVSGDDRAKDILGYSDGGSFPTENIPENFKNWMSFYEKELKALAAIPDTTTGSSSNFSVTKELRTANTGIFPIFINPLLGTIQWDQSQPYNILCPKIGSVQVPTGCVATAMAQIMKYYQWPLKGTGTKTYRSDQVTNALTVDFSRTTYDWANMTNTYNGDSNTPIQDTAVATLMYHCGVAVSMDYTPYSSGAYSNDIPAALSTYFGYDENAQLYTRNFYSEAEWIRLIKTDLKSSRPVIYGGGSNEGDGHQFICDGYDSDDLFHFNWGWSGSCNGYFELTSLNVTTPGTGGGTGGYSIGQDLITGIQKPTTKSVKTYQLYLLQDLNVENETTPRNALFNIDYGFANYGSNTFDGYIALGLYQNNTLVSIIRKFNRISLSSYYGDSDFTADSLSIPSSVPNGTYQIYSVYKATDQDSWSVMRNKVGTPNALDVSITSSYLTFSTPDVRPKLSLDGTIKVVGNLYKDKTARLSATIKNTGSEFNSYLIFKLCSTTDGQVVQVLNFDIVNIPAGATKTIELTGSLRVATGDYILKLMYDYSNNQDSPSLTLLTPDANNSVGVSVINAPTLAPALTLTERVSLTDSTITKGSEAKITAKIKNTGGYFNNMLAAFIFSGTENSSIDYFGPLNVILDTDEEKEITFYKDMNLDEGEYNLALYYYNDSVNVGWKPLTPDIYGRKEFTVINPVVYEEAARIYQNLATDLLYIQSPSLMKSVSILDTSGKQILKQEPLTAGTISVMIKDLSKGVYLIKIDTEEGSCTYKFLKK
ncbi:MAG: thiol protease/hemagglutinin PrtT [Bacteroidales bacterium]|nr:thiol protease/hemagglutinin PrtT [Bacteroidales bacterium]